MYVWVCVDGGWCIVCLSEQLCVGVWGGVHAYACVCVRVYECEKEGSFPSYQVCCVCNGCLSQWLTNVLHVEWRQTLEQTALITDYPWNWSFLIYQHWHIHITRFPTLLPLSLSLFLSAYVDISTHFSLLTMVLCVQICVSVCMCVFIHNHTFKHTHTHTHTLENSLNYMFLLFHNVYIYIYIYIYSQYFINLFKDLLGLTLMVFR